ncbi:MAG: MarR family transcriptional regulator [Ilumatobacteraceae bacterium]|nr:MarR family transcriptional regulator [Ilumatobacteraceae bacterium]
MSAGEIAIEERVQPQSLTRTLNELEADGLIRRRPDVDDGRRALIDLTAAGRKALAAEVAPRDAWLEEAMRAVLSPLERELLRLAAPLLARLGDSV